MYSRVGGAWARKRDRKEKLFPSSASLAAKSLFPPTFITLPLPVTASARVLHCVPDKVCFWKGFWYTAIFLLFQKPFGAICSYLPKFWNARNFFKYV